MNKTFTGNEGNRNDLGDLLYGLIIQRTIKQQNITCGAAATKVPTVPLSKRKSLELFNNSGNIIYLGASNVTTANGFPLYPHSSISIQIEDSIDVYMISVAGTEDIRVLEGA